MRNENFGTSAPCPRASPVLRSGLSDSMSNGRLRTRTSICGARSLAANLSIRSSWARWSLTSTSGNCASISY